MASRMTKPRIDAVNPQSRHHLKDAMSKLLRGPARMAVAASTVALSVAVAACTSSARPAQKPSTCVATIGAASSAYGYIRYSYPIGKPYTLIQAVQQNGIDSGRVAQLATVYNGHATTIEYLDGKPINVTHLNVTFFQSTGTMPSITLASSTGATTVRYIGISSISTPQSTLLSLSRSGLKGLVRGDQADARAWPGDNYAARSCIIALVRMPGVSVSNVAVTSNGAQPSIPAPGRTTSGNPLAIGDKAQ